MEVEIRSSSINVTHLFTTGTEAMAWAEEAREEWTPRVHLPLHLPLATPSIGVKTQLVCNMIGEDFGVQS